MRVRAGEHRLHADRADEHARRAALASVPALLPCQAVGADDVDASNEHGVREGAQATGDAPSTGGVQSSCCVVMSRRVARAPRLAAARRPECPGFDHHASGMLAKVTATDRKCC